MRRGAALAAAVVTVILLVATACSSDAKTVAKDTASSRPAVSAAAATVGGTQVPASAVTTDLEAEVSAGSKGKRQTDPGNPLASPKAKDGTYTPAARAAALTSRILYELYGQQLRSFGTKVGAADKTSAHTSLCADANTGQVPAGTSCPPLAAYPSAYQTFQLSLRERELALGTFLYGRIFDTVRRTDPTVLRQVCVNLVQVAGDAVATQIVKDVKAGKSMTQASAAAVKAGKASKVQPACLFVAMAPTELSKAKLKDVVPLKTQSTFGVAQVTSFRTATREQFASNPPTRVASVQKNIKAEVDRSIRKVKVSVKPTYGTWDPTQLMVKAPSTKKPATSAPSTTG